MDLSLSTAAVSSFLSSFHSMSACFTARTIIFQRISFIHAFCRGKAAYTHSGNKSFRATLEFHLDRYANAQTKPEKTEIVSMIFRAIQAATPQGGFIRQNDKGEWCRVPASVAREKVRLI
jgi:hypothetical protein